MSEAPPKTRPASSATSDGWHLVQRLRADGVSREQMLEKLKASGLNDESAKVLINSVVGDTSPGANVLSTGLTGPPTTVGLYWMGFGAAILIVLGLGFLVTDLLGKDLVPDDVGISELRADFPLGFYALWLGGFASMCSVGWGLFRYSQGVAVRRK